MPIVANNILTQVNNSEIKLDGSFDIPPGVTHIGDFAFSECPSLQTLTIPQGVTCIGEYVFSECTSLQSLILPPGVTSLANGALHKCTSLQTLTLPPGVTRIGNYAFSECTNLQTLILPPGVTYIGDYAFKQCPNLSRIIIDSSDVKEIERVRQLFHPYSSYVRKSAARFNVTCNYDIRDYTISNYDVSTYHIEDKVISKESAQEFDARIETQISRVANTPEVNPLYSFFGAKGGLRARGPFDKQLTLPDDVLSYINTFTMDTNPDCQKARDLMYKVPIPRTSEQIENYQSKLQKIADEIINKKIADEIINKTQQSPQETLAKRQAKENTESSVDEHTWGMKKQRI